MAVIPSNPSLRFIHGKSLLTPKNAITVKLFLGRVSFESYWWTLKPANSHSLAISFSTVRLRKSRPSRLLQLRVRLREVAAYERLEM